MSDTTIRVLASFSVKPDQAEAFKSMMRGLREPTRAQPGCIAYDLQQSLEDPASFVFVEEWRSEADLENHLTTAHVQSIAPALQDMLTSPPKVQLYRALW